VPPSVVRDVVVVLPGIMGSALAQHGRPVWSLGGGLLRGLVTLGGSVGALALPEGIGDDHPGDGVKATGLLDGLHVIPGLWSPVTGYAGLVRFLRGARFHLLEAPPADPDRMANLVAFPYDWRLSNRCNARRLKTEIGPVLERWRDQPGMEDAKLVLVCHSMGGLVARWFVEREGGAEITRALVSLGTPYRGAVNALETLVNGVRAPVGPLRSALTRLAGSLPSLYELLPTYACMVAADGTRRPVSEAGVPGLSAAMLRDAAAFHAELDAAAAAAGDPAVEVRVCPTVGIRQPTATTARWAHGRLIVEATIDGRDDGGDGTVPRLSAQPLALRGVAAHGIAEQHGALQANRAVWDQLDQVLTAATLVWEAAETDPEADLAVQVDPVWAAGAPLEVWVAGGAGRRVQVVVVDEQGRETGVAATARPAEGRGRAVLEPLAPGGYQLVVRAVGDPSGFVVPPVTAGVLVWDPGAPVPEGGLR